MRAPGDPIPTSCRPSPGKRCCNWPPTGPPRPDRCLILSRGETPPTARGVPIVWVHSLLHCGLEEGHDPPHVAVPPGYWRPVRWVRERSWSRPSPTGASHRSAIIPPVTQPLPAQGHFPKDRFGNDPLRDRHLPSGRHLAPLGDRIRPPARLCLGPMAGRPVRSGQQQPLQAWSLEGAVGDATFGFSSVDRVAASIRVASRRTTSTGRAAWETRGRCQAGSRPWPERHRAASSGASWRRRLTCRLASVCFPARMPAKDSPILIGHS